MHEERDEIIDIEPELEKVGESEEDISFSKAKSKSQSRIAKLLVWLLLLMLVAAAAIYYEAFLRNSPSLPLGVVSAVPDNSKDVLKQTQPADKNITSAAPIVRGEEEASQDKDYNDKEHIKAQPIAAVPAASQGARQEVKKLEQGHVILEHEPVESSTIKDRLLDLKQNLQGKLTQDSSSTSHSLSSAADSAIDNKIIDHKITALEQRIASLEKKLQETSAINGKAGLDNIAVNTQSIDKLSQRIEKTKQTLSMIQSATLASLWTDLRYRLNNSSDFVTQLHRLRDYIFNSAAMVDMNDKLKADLASCFDRLGQLGNKKILSSEQLVDELQVREQQFERSVLASSNSALSGKSFKDHLLSWLKSQVVIEDLSHNQQKNMASGAIEVEKPGSAAFWTDIANEIRHGDYLQAKSDLLQLKQRLDPSWQEFIAKLDDKIEISKLANQLSSLLQLDGKKQ